MGERQEKKFCPYCGKEIPAEDMFCVYCGKKLIYSNNQNIVGLKRTNRIRIFMGLCILAVLILIIGIVIKMRGGYPDNGEFLHSSSIQEYKGKVYTVYAGGEKNWKYLPRCSYMDDMLVYKDHLYYTSVGGTGETEYTIYESDLNGENEKAIAEEAASHGFSVYQNYLYYDCYDVDSGDEDLYRINLDTMKEELVSEDYVMPIYMDENYWVFQIEEDYDYTYISGPDLKNPYVLADVSTYQFMSMGKDGFYYCQDGQSDTREQQVHRIDYNSLENEAIHLTNYNTVNEIEGHLYYAEYDSNILVLRNWKNDEESQFDFSEQNLRGMGCVFEKNNKAYVIGHNPDADARHNTEMHRVNLSNGKIEGLGSWFQS